MRRLSVLLGLAAIAAIAAASSPARSSRVVSFKTPSGNIGCLYVSDPDVLRCDIRSGLNPRPARPRRCRDLEYGDAVEMRTATRPFLVCHGDTALDPRSRVLPYGRSIGMDGFQCTSRVTGLTCTNTRGHGWFLSRESYRIF